MSNRDGRVVSGLPQPGYKQTEVGVIPEDWEVKFFKDVCWVNQGLQIPISNRKKISTSKSKIYITIQFLNDSKEVEYIDDYSSSVCCEEDDVLMTRTGNTGIVVSGVEGVFHNNFFKINFDKRQIVKDFLIYYLNQNKTQRIIITKAGTSTIPDLNHNDFYSIPIPIPPTLAEQTAITTALFDTDALIGSLEKLIAKKRDIKQGAMQELLTGKKRLPGFGGKTEKYKQSEVGLIPEDWNLLTIGQVVSFSGGSQPPRSTFVFEKKNGYVRLIQIRDYKTDEFITFIPEELVKKKCTKEDIMIGRYGPPIFQILRGIEGAYNVALIKAIPLDTIEKEYLFHFFKQDLLFRFVEGLSQRTSGQTGIEMDALKKYPIPLPDRKEQIAIAAVLSDMDTEIEALEKKLSKYHLVKRGMMQELLTGKTRLI